MSSNKSSKKSSKKPPKKTSKKCSKGQISVDGFTRSAYKRHNSRNNKTTKIKSTKVNTYCRKDLGSPGKTPESKKKLPKPSDGYFSLSRMGYSAYDKDNNRHKILNQASKEYGTLDVLRHLNLRANYQQWNKEAYDNMKNDVDFLSREYARSKNINKKTSKKKSSKK